MFSNAYSNASQNSVCVDKNEKKKKIYFTHIEATNIRNIFLVLMLQQFFMNKHHRLRDSTS